MIRFLGALLLSASLAGAGAVTRMDFSRSGGQLPGRSVAGVVKLHNGSGRVTAANGYARELGPEEVSGLRAALAQPAPPLVHSPDAYRYEVRIEKGKKTRSMTLTDASLHPLVPWLQKETAAIARFGRQSP